MKNKAKNMSSVKNLNFSKSIDNLEEKTIKRRNSHSELPSVVNENPDPYKSKKRSVNLSKIESKA